MHSSHFLSLHIWQEKQSLQLCFLAAPGERPGTYTRPVTPRILI